MIMVTWSLAVLSYMQYTLLAAKAWLLSNVYNLKKS